jgi:hypothetical protein
MNAAEPSTVSDDAEHDDHDHDGAHDTEGLAGWLILMIMFVMFAILAFLFIRNIDGDGSDAAGYVASIVSQLAA